MVDNHHINDLDLKWWRSQIGLVQQEPFLFNDSIYNNVAFGLIGSKWESESEDVKMELVTEACKEAFAEEFISRLPQVIHHVYISVLPALLNQSLLTISTAGLFDGHR